MASIAIMTGGAIINATAFVGGSYLAKYLSGGSNAEKERNRHDLAVEKYQAAYEKYKENRTKLMDIEWIGKQKQNFENTDYALKLYNKVHQDKMNLEEPEFSDFYQPSSNQKQGELIYVGVGALAIVLAASHFI